MIGFRCAALANLNVCCAIVQVVLAGFGFWSLGYNGERGK